MAETPLEQCRRHVAEAAERIAQQELLIIELERGGHHDLLPAAQGLLTILRDAQRLGEEHLARELAEAETPS